MKDIIGIIGGMGSHAAADFFTRLVNHSPGKNDQDYIEVILHNNSRIPDRTEAIIHHGESPLPELIRSAKILERAGAKIIVLACITAHYFYNDVQKSLETATLINIVDETVEYTIKTNPNLKCVGIIATTGSIRSGIWQNAFKTKGIETVVLSTEDQEEYFTKVIYGENSVKAGCFTDEHKAKLKQGFKILKGLGAEAVVGGCSELPILLSNVDFEEDYIDSLDIARGKIISHYYK